MLKVTVDNHVRHITNITFYVITILIIITTSLSISNHELWLDEAHHLLLVKNSSSYAELLNKMKYEGHPPL
ncbi:MAG: hypothetical protein ACRC3B_07100, partial [Bacteroidia bacterium]